MFRRDNNAQIIEMDEGDFGVSLFFRITNSEDLSAKISIEGTNIVDKDLPKDEKGRFELKFTEQESEELTPGQYCWDLVLYGEGINLRLVSNKIFRVVKG